MTSGAQVADVGDVKRAVADALPVVRAHAEEADRCRRLDDDVVETLRRTGINRLLLPRELGGLEAAVLDVMDVVEQIATVDGSTAWTVMIGSGSNLFAGFLPESGARRAFADPDQGSATMLAPAGILVPDGGRFRLSGRWPFTSNCLHSEWIGLGAMLKGPNGDDPTAMVAFVRASALTIEQTWDSMGLRGTGSHHVIAADAVVEPDECCEFNAAVPWTTATPWRLPLFTTFLSLLACVPLGVARGALDEIARQAHEGRDARRGQVTEDPIALAELGTADVRLLGARAGLRAAVGEAQELAAARRPVGPVLQARVCLAAQVANDIAVEVTAVAHALGGGGAAYEGSLLLRALADVHAARQHLLFSPKHRVELAKALIGLDVDYPPFVTSASGVNRGA